MGPLQRLDSARQLQICEPSFFIVHDQRLLMMESTFCACMFAVNVSECPCWRTTARQLGLDRLEARRPSTTSVRGWLCETKYNNVASFEKWTPPLQNGPRSYILNRRWPSTLVILPFLLSAIVTLGWPACHRILQCEQAWNDRHRWVLGWSNGVRWVIRVKCGISIKCHVSPWKFTKKRNPFRPGMLLYARITSTHANTLAIRNTLYIMYKIEAAIRDGRTKKINKQE